MGDQMNRIEQMLIPMYNKFIEEMKAKELKEKKPEPKKWLTYIHNGFDTDKQDNGGENMAKVRVKSCLMKIKGKGAKVRRRGYLRKK